MVPFLLNLRDPSLQAPVSFCPCSLAQAVPTSPTELMVRPSAMNKTTDYSETAVCLLCYPGEGNDSSLVASDLSWDLMLFSSHLCLSTIGHRIFGFSSPWPFLPYNLFQDVFRCRACLVSTSPRQEKFFSKAISQRHLTYLQEGAERFSPL